MSRARAKEWYAGDGRTSALRFECTQCGACCTGPEGAVLVNDKEIHTLAEQLGITPAAFAATYTHIVPEGRSLIERETAPGSGMFDCVFLERRADGAGVCTVYGARPTQCRTFPWWPDNLKHEKAWESVAKHCEGIGRGGFVPLNEIRIQRDTQASAHPVQRTR